MPFQFLMERAGFFNRSDLDKSTIPGHQLMACDKKVPVLWFEPLQPSRRVILFFHGNAATLRTTAPLLRKMRDQFHCHVMAFEFPSYGMSPDLILSAPLLRKRAIQFIDFVHDTLKFEREQMFLVSFCMGNVVSFYLAAQRRVGGFVSIAPFSSIRHYMRNNIFRHAIQGDGGLNNMTFARHVNCPTLIVHGTKDTASHIRDVFALFGAIRHSNKSLHRIPDEKHLMDWNRAVIPSIQQFIQESGIQLGRVVEQKEAKLRGSTEPSTQKQQQHQQATKTQQHPPPTNIAAFLRLERARRLDTSSTTSADTSTASAAYVYPSIEQHRDLFNMESVRSNTLTQSKQYVQWSLYGSAALYTVYKAVQLIIS